MESSSPSDAGEVGVIQQMSRLKRIITHRHSHWWALGTSVAILLAIGIIWMIGGWSLRTLRIADHQLKARNVAKELPALLNEQDQAYRIRVQYPGQAVKEYSLKDAGLAIDVTASVNATKKQARKFRSYLLWWQEKPVQIVLKSEPAKLTEFINTKARTVTKPVVNAVVGLTPQGTVQVTEGTPGQEVGLQNGDQDVLVAVKSLQTTPLKLAEHTIQPAITKESTKDVVSKLQGALARAVIFTVQGNQITASAGDIANWFVLTPNIPKQTYDVTVDAGKVDDYINGQVANYVRLPRDQVEVKQPDGSTRVLVSGISGLDVVNKDEISQALQKNALGTKDLKLDLNVDETPFKTVSANAGDKMIEVDLTNKRMYVYESGVLLRTFLISAGAPATPTVTGTYAIYSKIRSQNMRGFNADGSTYFQPNVAFVNYFYRDYAIHGNYWRPVSYFGNINSSHGCVGIADTDAEWIYNWAPIGTPVVVHY